MADARSRTRPTSTDRVSEALLGDAATFVRAADAAADAQAGWAAVPAPVRGEVIQHLGELVRANKEALAALITREIGKPIAESRGEVQEVIDTCAFFQSEGRRLYGMTVPSELPDKQLFTFRTPVGTFRDHHRGQLPGGGALLVHRAGAAVRQHRGVEAGGVHARHRRGVRPADPARRCADGRVPAWCSPTDPRPSPGSSARSRTARSERSASPGRPRSAPGSASCAGDTCRRRVWSSAGRTRSS